MYRVCARDDVLLNILLRLYVREMEARGEDERVKLDEANYRGAHDIMVEGFRCVLSQFLRFIIHLHIRWGPFTTRENIFVCRRAQLGKLASNLS